MKKLSFALLMMILLLPVSCSGRFAQARAARKAEMKMTGHSGRFKESFRVRMAKKQQERRQQKIKKDYARYVKNSRQRTFDIQSPEVKERMKRNEDELKTREKMKARHEKKSTRKAGNKYK
ncbi:MAG TPA: hypothetical protein VHO68_15815 [Bacteroidales bacterium]|nr:hypothetical protein [Bacteroidales bacterium]